jgi:hypothetical protein
MISSVCISASIFNFKDDSEWISHQSVYILHRSSSGGHPPQLALIRKFSRVSVEDVCIMIETRIIIEEILIPM